jgi:hypothetical protein
MRITRLCLMMLLLTWLPCRIFATVKTSAENGDWRQIAWIPAGMPIDGDSIVIATDVTGMPPGVRGRLMVAAGASLGLDPGVSVVEGLVNEGVVSIVAGAVLKVDGDIVCNGSIAGAGSLEMIADGGAVAGGGMLGNVVLNIGAGGVIHAASALTMQSLYVGRENQLRLDSFDLTVLHSFISSAPFGEPGITASTGLISLNGPAHGSARGSVRFGVVQMEGTKTKPVPPSTYGTFGDAGATVTFTGQRSISFSRLVGLVVIDTNAIVTAIGFGANGGNTIEGSLWVYGRLTAADDCHVWMLNGNLYNHGRIDHATIMMRGHQMVLRTDTGTWGWDASLSFFGDTGAELQIHGAMTLPRLTIGAMSGTDTGITVNAGMNAILVRHQFTSDRTRSCRLTADTVVRLRGDADGIIDADVKFEGFWDSRIGGLYGGSGRTVSFTMPKRVVSPMVVDGTFVQSPNARLTSLSSLSVPASAEFMAELEIDTGATITTIGNITLHRAVRGGGALELIAPTATLDVRAGLLDSLVLRIGRDTIISQVFIARTFSVPHMIVHPSSTFIYGEGDSVDVTQELRYRIAVAQGFSMMSSAVVPFDPNPAASFPGATSVFEFDPSTGYSLADTIQPGSGYWVSFPAPRIIEQRGRILNAPFTYPVTGNWDIIGGASIPTAVSRMETTGTSRLTDVFRFMEGYGAVETMAPGRGYWVQFSAAGSIMLKP